MTSVITIMLLLTAFVGCKQTQADRYERYLEDVTDSSSMIEYITPETDSLEVPEDDGDDPFADDEGIYTIPDIPQEREVDMNANNYELEKMMRGAE